MGQQLGLQQAQQLVVFEEQLVETQRQE